MLLWVRSCFRTAGGTREQGRARKRNWWRGAKALVRGLPQSSPFWQGCVGELPSRCTTGVGELCCSDWVWREHGRMPTGSTEACSSVMRGRTPRTSDLRDDQSGVQEARPIAEKGRPLQVISTMPTSDAGRHHSHRPSGRRVNGRFRVPSRVSSFPCSSIRTPFSYGYGPSPCTRHSISNTDSMKNQA